MHIIHYWYTYHKKVASYKNTCFIPKVIYKQKNNVYVYENKSKSENKSTIYRYRERTVAEQKPSTHCK